MTFVRWLADTLADLGRHLIVGWGPAPVHSSRNTRPRCLACGCWEDGEPFHALAGHPIPGLGQLCQGCEIDLLLNVEYRRAMSR